MDTPTPTESTKRRRRTNLRRPRPNGDGPIAPLALVIAGITFACIGILLLVGIRTSTPENTVSGPTLTAVLDAAEAGQLASVTLPGTGSAATAETSRVISTGELAEANGGPVPAGTRITFQAPASAHPAILEALNSTGTPVRFSAASVRPGARGTSASSTSETETPSPPIWQSGLGILLTAAGIALIVLGAQRHFTARTRKKSEVVPDTVTTRFSDVAGADEAVEQMRELVDFLAHPQRYLAIGATLPKGALLVGPPGTGKTLLARALAGEAGVPIITATGSQFVEMYVGVGARRIRDLFKAARAHPRAIVFIDEIDAIARRRTDSSSGGNNAETENTLIALLTEMDGFAENSQVVVIAATNRPDILDPALTRPGRLDRRIEVPLPDRRGREQILGVHSAKVQLADDVDLALLARRTPGFSGAQLAAVVNEAALEAVRRGHERVDRGCFDAAIAGVAMGRARASALVTEHDRRITAWHEAGHTVAALLLADADPPAAVSIVPRGPAGGVTWMAGSDNQFLSRAKAHASLVVALAGRAAEVRLLGGEYTQGASGDLQAATDTALRMATVYGMTRLGLASRTEHLGGTTTKEVAEVVEELLADAHREAALLLETHHDLVEAIAEELLEHEDLHAGDLARIATRLGLAPDVVPTPVPAPPVHARRTPEPPDASGSAADGSTGRGARQPSGPERPAHARKRVRDLVHAITGRRARA